MNLFLVRKQTRSPRIWRLAEIFFISLKPGGLQGCRGARLADQPLCVASPRSSAERQRPSDRV